MPVEGEATVALNMFFQHCDFDGLKHSTTTLVVISPYGTMHDHACFPSQTQLAFSLYKLINFVSNNVTKIFQRYLVLDILTNPNNVTLTKKVTF